MKEVQSLTVKRTDLEGAVSPPVLKRALWINGISTGAALCADGFLLTLVTHNFLLFLNPHQLFLSTSYFHIKAFEHMSMTTKLIA